MIRLVSTAKKNEGKLEKDKLDHCNFRLLKVRNCIGGKRGGEGWRGRCFNSVLKGKPNFQGILNWILQIWLYHCDKQHKNINNLKFIEQNIFSFSPSLFPVACASSAFLNSRCFSVLWHSTLWNFKPHKWSFVALHKKTVLAITSFYIITYLQ